MHGNDRRREQLWRSSCVHHAAPSARAAWRTHSRTCRHDLPNVHPLVSLIAPAHQCAKTVGRSSPRSASSSQKRAAPLARADAPSGGRPGRRPSGCACAASRPRCACGPRSRAAWAARAASATSPCCRARPRRRAPPRRGRARGGTRWDVLVMPAGLVAACCGQQGTHMRWWRARAGARERGSTKLACSAEGLSPGCGHAWERQACMLG